MKSQPKTVLDLSPEDLRILSEINQKRLDLQRQMDDLTMQATKIINGDGRNPELNAVVAEAKRSRITVARGTIKNAILAALKSAGAKGMHMSKLAERVPFPRLTIERWLYSRSAANTKGFSKMGQGRFRFVPASSEASGSSGSVKPRSAKH